MLLGNEHLGRYTKKYFWTDSSFLLAIAGIIGTITGFAGIGFRKAIGYAEILFFSGGEKVLEGLMGNFYIVLLPALGGLLVGLIVCFIDKEVRGPGVSPVMAAVAQRDGIISPRLAITKFVATSVNLGSGGSGGTEGPIVHIGAALGSAVGQFLKLSPGILKTLVACGAAGGISATFNAPIGGVLFAQEIILGEFVTTKFILIVISSVTSATISRAVLGNYPAFFIQQYNLVHSAEILFFLVLGILSGIFAVLYIKTLYRIEDFFANWQHGIPEYLKPAVGGLLIGVIGLYFPQIFGLGYNTIETVLDNGLTLKLMVVLLFLKLLATSLTIGSGGSAGVIGPSLFMGAMLGGSFGYILNSLFPELTAPFGAYALVGMAGVFAGMSQAPVTGIIMLFEMTDNYMIVLPLMIVCVISSLVASGLHPESIFTERLARMGLDTGNREDIDLMATIPVEKVMTTDVVVMDADMDLISAREIMQQYSFTGFPVVKDGQLIGIVTQEDIHRKIKKGSTLITLETVVGTNLLTLNPHNSVRQAIQKMAGGDVGRLPVVDPLDPTKLLGIISRSDIINAYSLANKGGMEHENDNHRN
ncbi:MAG: chloride channel protein [Syntrophomonadaceae bacterium]|jgi:CIC family chloride channel protein